MFEAVDIGALEAPPANLLPAALPELLGHDAEGSLTALFYAPEALKYVPVAEPFLDQFRDQNALLAAFDGIDPQRPVTLGPRATCAKRELRTLNLPRRGKPDPKPDQSAEIGIIDAGIAFWNPAFANAGGSNPFKSITGLNFDLNGGGVDIARLTDAQLEQCVNRGGTIEGDLENQQDMAALLPSSVFSTINSARPFYANTIAAHGTSMAEMVMATAPADARLHGLELPTAVLRDLSGGQLRGVLDFAVRALVDSVVAKKGNCGGFRLVVLIAFGILGGPQNTQDPDARDALLAQLQQTQQDLLDTADIDVQFVFPMGNHRQDRCHGQLPGGEALDWIVQSDDHSENTLEILHDAEIASFSLQAPDGQVAQFAVPAGNGLKQLVLDNQSIGAVWSQPVTQTLTRTRLTLAPSAARAADEPRAPFGRWRLSHTSDQVLEIWVLRDETGFEATPGQAFRRSWLEDGYKTAATTDGAPTMVDAPGAGARVLRQGTASVLCDAPGAGMICVGAQTRWSDAADNLHEAAYSGARKDGGSDPDFIDLAAHAPVGYFTNGPFARRAVLGNGSGRRFWAAGTSLAAALFAGSQAH